MKTLSAFFRTLVVSPEFVLLLASATVLLYWPEWFRSISTTTKLSADQLKYLGLLPAPIAIWALTISRKILFPEYDKKKLLQKWGEYQKLKTVCHVAVAYSFFFAIVGVVGWIIATSLPEVAIGALLTALIGAGIVMFSCWCAEITINEIFAKECPPKKEW